MLWLYESNQEESFKQVRALVSPALEEQFKKRVKQLKIKMNLSSYLSMDDNEKEDFDEEMFEKLMLESNERGSIYRDIIKPITDVLDDNSYPIF